MKTQASIILLTACFHSALAQHVHEPAPAQPELDPHAGHAMPGSPQTDAAVMAAEDPHAGHDMAPMNGTGNMDSMPVGESTPPPAAYSGPAHAADLLYDSNVMAAAREELRIAHGDYTGLFLMADRFEMQDRDGDSMTLWDVQGWYGSDEHRLWIKTEGEVTRQDDEFELQTLWSHAFHPWFDFQTGLRMDFSDGLETTYLAVGVQGLLPYRFETDTAVFLSGDGDLSARLEGEYDWWLTQKLILQPRIELNLSAQDIPDKAIGSGVQNIEAGLRLRYQIRREIAPYFGIEYRRSFSGTADYSRRAGLAVSDSYALLGFQAWF